MIKYNFAQLFLLSLQLTKLNLIKYQDLLNFMQKQKVNQSTKGRPNICVEQGHNSEQPVQYVCTQQGCYGASRLTCKKCFRKYHFSHSYLPLRKNLNLMKSQEQQQHSNSIKLKLQSEKSVLLQFQSHIRQVINKSISTVIRKQEENVRKLEQTIFNQKQLVQAIQSLRYCNGQTLTDQFVQRQTKIMIQFSEQDENIKFANRNNLVQDLSDALVNFKSLANSLCSEYSQKILMLVQKSQRNRIANSQLSVPQNKKDKLKAKIVNKQAVSKLQKTTQKHQANFTSYSTKIQTSNQSADLKSHSTVKYQQKQVQLNRVFLFFDNPQQKTINKKIRELQKQQEFDDKLRIHSIKIKFDGVKAFIPKLLLQNVPKILKDLKTIKIDMYQTFKEPLLWKIVQNFSDLQQLSITECQSFSDELLDLIVQRNPNLKRFYTFFNFKQNFDEYLKSYFFKRPPLKSKLKLKQCLKLTQLQQLQNIHIFNCDDQLTPLVLSKMKCLKQVSFGGYVNDKNQDRNSPQFRKQIKDTVLQALMNKYLNAVSFFNVQVDTSIDTDKIFKWINTSGKNLNTLILDGFKRVTDKHIKMFAAQCQIKQLIVEHSNLKGNYIGNLKQLRSLVLRYTKINQTDLFISKRNKKKIQYLILQKPEYNYSFDNKFYWAFRNLKLVYLCPNNWTIQLQTFEKMQRLQVLIFGFKTKITVQMLQALNNQCPKLKRIRCSQIETPFKNQKYCYNQQQKLEQDQYIRKCQQLQISKLIELYSKLTHISSKYYQHSNYTSKIIYLYLHIAIDKKFAKQFKKLFYLHLPYVLKDKTVQLQLLKQNVFIQKCSQGIKQIQQFEKQQDQGQGQERESEQCIQPQISQEQQTQQQDQDDQQDRPIGIRPDYSKYS